MDMMSIKDKEKRKQMLKIYSILILLIMVIELLFRGPLFHFSGTAIIYLQQNFSDNSYRWFFLIISGFGTPRILVVLMLILFATEAKKFLTLKLTIYICFVGYMVSIVKSIYRNPRPYWVWPSDSSFSNYISPGITPYEHYAEYGNPSGHAFLVTAFYGYLYYIFLYKKAKDIPGIGHEERAMSLSQKLEPLQKEQRSISESENEFSETEKDIQLNIDVPDKYPKEEVKESPFYLICKALYFSLVFLVCLSRMYLGMHSLNQVLLGLSFGCYSLFIIVYYVDPLLDSFLKSLRAKTLSNRLAVAIILLVIYIVLSIIPIFLYIKNENNSENEWFVWWPVVQKELNPSLFTFAHIKCYMDCGALGIGFGVVFALLAQENNYLERGLKFTALTRLGILFRIIIFGLTVGFTAGIIFILPMGENNWTLKYIINSNLAAFVGCYSAIRLAPVAYEKLGLEADRFFNHPRDLHIDTRTHLL